MISRNNPFAWVRSLDEEGKDKLWKIMVVEAKQHLRPKAEGQNIS